MDDATWHAVLSSEVLDVCDVLRCSRLCKRLHSLVMDDALLWRLLCQRHHGPAPPAAAAQEKTPAAAAAAAAAAQALRRHYKDRHVRAARERRINRRVQHITLLSAVQDGQARRNSLQQQLGEERRRRNRLQSDLQNLVHLRRVQATAQEWQLHTFKLYANRVAQAVPIQAEWRIRHLEHDLTESGVRVQGLEESLSEAKRQLAQRKRRLADFEGQAS